MSLLSCDVVRFSSVVRINNETVYRQRGGSNWLYKVLLQLWLILHNTVAVSNYHHHHPASSLYSTVTILRSDAPLNLRAFFEPYLSFFWVGIIQGGLKSSLRFSGGLKKCPKKFRGA